jgi:hypothetical protein
LTIVNKNGVHEVRIIFPVNKIEEQIREEQLWNIQENAFDLERIEIGKGKRRNIDLRNI